MPQEVRGASITLLQQCRRGDDLLVEARVRVAFVSGGKAQRIPKPLRLAMEAGRIQAAQMPQGHEGAEATGASKPE
jgi:acyl-CoA thioester hydrolase